MCNIEDFSLLKTRPLSYVVQSQLLKNKNKKEIITTKRNAKLAKLLNFKENSKIFNKKTTLKLNKKTEAFKRTPRSTKLNMKKIKKHQTSAKDESHKQTNIKPPKTKPKSTKSSRLDPIIIDFSERKKKMQSSNYESHAENRIYNVYKWISINKIFISTVLIVGCLMFVIAATVTLINLIRRDVRKNYQRMDSIDLNHHLY